MQFKTFQDNDNDGRLDEWNFDKEIGSCAQCSRYGHGLVISAAVKTDVELTAPADIDFGVDGKIEVTSTCFVGWCCLDKRTR